eukprot:TRINITY_DN12010_c0_g1_i1.p1 TRINITY_DN12010_c0_g1~~TRINITY_DN12010_c0_g1_i1.p1  ORF type:complete len:493 (+),score=80.32 TRINITY_DN12010_c0_g1_i1:89-1567(+)
MVVLGVIYNMPSCLLVVAILSAIALCQASTYECNAGADNTAAIQALIGTSGAADVTISGYCTCDGTIDLIGRRGVRISGDVSTYLGANPNLEYRGSAGTFINATETEYIVIEQITLTASNPAFKGVLVDLSGSVAFNSKFFRFVSVFFWLSQAPQSTGVLLYAAIIGSFRDCMFLGGAVQIRTDGHSLTSTNGLSIDNCWFGGATTMPVYGGGMAIAIRSSVFETLADGSPGAYHCGGEETDGFVFEGNWAGDQQSGTAGQAWVTFSGPGVGTGVLISGNLIGGNPSFPTAGIDISAVAGYSITANSFVGTSFCVKSTGGSVSGGLIRGNSFDTTGAYVYPISAFLHSTDLSANAPPIVSASYLTATGSASHITNNVAVTVAQIDLPAGTWDVQGLFVFVSNDVTTTTSVAVTVSQVGDGAFPCVLGEYAGMYTSRPPGDGGIAVSTPLVRYTLLSPTTVYANMICALAASGGEPSGSASAKITARFVTTSW